ncbi:MAG: AbrB/MazE/SpoVT family DNA-binding domain-containing protein [Candidatus Micrarchaeota archaeon]
MAKVYEKGIVVIPKHIQKMAGIRKGTEISFRVENKKVVIEPEDGWWLEFEEIRNEISKLCGKGIGKRIKMAEKKYKNRFKHVY